ncbi:MAG: hypothetical protein ACLVEJ_18590 [Parabacteroides sp.]
MTVGLELSVTMIKELISASDYNTSRCSGDCPFDDGSSISRKDFQAGAADDYSAETVQCGRVADDVSVACWLRGKQLKKTLWKAFLPGCNGDRGAVGEANGFSQKLFDADREAYPMKSWMSRLLTHGNRYQPCGTSLPQTQIASAELLRRWN